MSIAGKERKKQTMRKKPRRQQHLSANQPAWLQTSDGSADKYPHSTLPEQSFGNLGDMQGVSRHWNSWMNPLPRPGKQRLHKHCPWFTKKRKVLWRHAVYKLETESHAGFVLYWCASSSRSIITLNLNLGYVRFSVFLIGYLLSILMNNPPCFGWKEATPF